MQGKSSNKNLKLFKNKGLEFLTGIAKNRLCSVDGKSYTQVQNLEIPENGKMRASKKVWTSQSISQKFQKRSSQILRHVCA